jgi:hypothetical protein
MRVLSAALGGWLRQPAADDRLVAATIPFGSPLAAGEQVGPAEGGREQVTESNRAVSRIEQHFRTARLEQ